MKTITCNMLDGACDKAFHGNDFSEIEAQSKAHGKEMMQQGDEAHLQAMKNLSEKNQTPEQWQNWYHQKQELFQSLPHHD